MTLARSRRLALEPGGSTNHTRPMQAGAAQIGLRRPDAQLTAGPRRA